MPASHRGFFRLLLLCMLFCFACQKDYYSMIMQEGTCGLDGKTLSQSCKDSILRYAPIDRESFAEDPEVEQKVLEGLHLLLIAPMSFPKDKKMMGLSTMKEANMHDFYDRFVNHPEDNINQNMVNYVLNASLSLRQGCHPITNASYYTPEAIYICKAGRVSKKNLHPLSVASLLLHEARHHETGQHNSYVNVESDVPLVPRGDVGMDGPFGWEIALAWGVIHGNDENPIHLLDRIDMQEIIASFEHTFSYISALPSSLSSIRKNPSFFSNYQKYFPLMEKLQFPSMLRRSVFANELKNFTSDAGLSALISNMVTEDLDHDGNMDFLFGGKHGFQIFWGQESKTFQADLPVWMTNFDIVSITTLDANHDGVLDLLLTTSDANLYLLLLKKEGEANPIIRVSKIPIFGIRTIKSFDINQDGFADILYGREHGTYEVLFGTEKVGVFLDRQVIAQDTEGITQEGQIRWVFDINQDGHLDLVIVSENSRHHHVVFALGTGHGRFVFSPVAYDSDPSIQIVQGTAFSFFPLWDKREPSFFGVESGSSTLFRDDRTLYPMVLSMDKTGEVNLEKRNVISVGHPQYSQSTTNIADFNQDGLPDMIDISERGHTYGLSIFTQMQGGTFMLDESRQLTLPGNRFLDMRKSFIGDFNGDGYQDILLLSENTGFFVLYSEGNEHDAYVW